MAVRTVLKMGDKRLLRKAELVTEFDTPVLHALIQDMLDTMEALNGVGLAAPQIGINKRIIIFGFETNDRYPDQEAVPQGILINPKITKKSKERNDDWEGCLSVPGMRGVVSRATKIKYEGFDQTGKLVKRNASQFHARVIQHEIDHLDGILYPMRIKDMRSFGFEDVMFD